MSAKEKRKRIIEIFQNYGFSIKDRITNILNFTSSRYDIKNTMFYSVDDDGKIICSSIPIGDTIVIISNKKWYADEKLSTITIVKCILSEYKFSREMRRYWNGV